MKILKVFIVVILAIILFSPAYGQSTYKGHPLLKANSNKVNVRVGSVPVDGIWTVNPEYDRNTLHIQVNGQKEKLVLATAVDSIVYEVRPAKSEQFYVLLNKENYVFAEIKGFKPVAPVVADKSKKLLEIDKPRSKVFGALWEQHNVGEVVNDINNYADKASGALNWAKGKLFGSDN